MKRYRKLESWLGDVDHCLEHPAWVEKDALRELAYGFYCGDDQVVHDAGRLRMLLATLKKLRESKGPGRAAFEERVMGQLAFLANTVCGGLCETGFAPRPLSTLPETVAPAQRTSFVFLQELCRYAIDCLAFSRPRDTLAGRRRSISFEIMAASLEAVELPESVFDDLKRILKSARGNSIYGALVFCEACYGLQSDGVPDGMEDALLRVVDKTDSRGIAAGALNVLVEAGNISEFEALDRIEDWKERTNYGFWSG